MDTLRGFEEDRIDQDDYDREDLLVDDDQAVDIGSDERRMHVRAYNHWVSLLRNRAFPAIEDLDPENIADFGPHSVLLDFTGGIDDPAIRFVGRLLRVECDLAEDSARISQVPSRSLLSRLTDHYLQIIANRAPVGFEAEFVNARGHNTMYRGILMPFSSDDVTIDFIYGVISWKELVAIETQAQLDAEVAMALRHAPKAAVTAAAWATGPSAERTATSDLEANRSALLGAVANPVVEAAEAPLLADQLMLAQQTAAAVRAADTRSRAALYRALGRAYDFANAAMEDPSGYAMLLVKARIAEQVRAPMTPIVKLVFGVDYDKKRVTEFAAVLSHARRSNVPTGALADFLDMAEGGIKGIVAAERTARRPAAKPTKSHTARQMLQSRTPIASLQLDTRLNCGDLILLVARAGEGGMVDIVGQVAGNAPGAERIIGMAAR